MKRERARLEPRRAWGVGQSFIFTFVDKDGSAVAVPLIGKARDSLEYFVLKEKFEAGVGQLEIAKEQINTMMSAVMQLGLPSLIATHLVVNRGMSLEQIVADYRGEESRESSCLLGLYGFPHQGKSSFGEALRQQGEIVVDIDEFSKGNRQWTAGEALDRIAEVFKKGNRPEMIIVDMPGYKVNPETGEGERDPDVFDFMARFGMESLEVYREVLAEEKGEKIIKVLGDGPMEAEVLENFKARFRNDLRSNCIDLSSTRDEIFLFTLTRDELNVSKYCSWYMWHKDLLSVKEDEVVESLEPEKTVEQSRTA